MRHSLLLFLTAGNAMLQLQLLLGRDTKRLLVHMLSES